MRCGLGAALGGRALFFGRHCVFKCRTIALDGLRGAKLTTSEAIASPTSIGCSLNRISLTHLIVTVSPLPKQHRVLLTV
jgi:hypothetical protein